MEMRIIFVRHAEAIERTESIADERRYLTPDGRYLFRKTAKTMRDEGLDPNLILTSPYLRAVQTADILAEKSAYIGSLMAVEELEPGFDMDALTRIILSYKPVKELVLVGHEPDLSTVISTLLSLPEGFRMEKGAAVKLSLDPDNLYSSASFKWMALGRKPCYLEKNRCRDLRIDRVNK
jgi:phosphohistidine phosphatase